MLNACMVALLETMKTHMQQVTFDPAGFFSRLPLQPHQMTDRFTRTEDTIVLCHLGVPRLAAGDWSLEIGGLVHRPLRFSFSDLLQRHRTEVASVHQCAGSPLRPEIPTRRICNVVWGGVRLADLLAECIPSSEARFVWSTGADYGVFDGVPSEFYVKDLPIERVGADVLVAFEMNGEPLRAENGFPVRLVVPGFYATNSVKWLTRIELTERRPAGPFTTRWYNDPVRDEAGVPTCATVPVWAIAPEAIIVAPGPQKALKAGAMIEIWGWAWGDGGIEAVDVSVDGGAGWMNAQIEPPAGRTWQRFSTIWRADKAGMHALCARARTADGRVQPVSGARNAIHTTPVSVA